MATKGRFKHNRVTHWMVSLIAIAAMVAAVLPAIAMPVTAAPINPLVITISYPASPPASSAVPINTTYNVAVSVTLNGSSNWSTTGGYQVPFGQAIRQVTCYANAADSSGHYYVNYVTITNGTGTFSYTEQTTGLDSVTCNANDYTYGSGGHQYSASSNALSVGWVNPNVTPPTTGNPTAVLGATVSCSACPGSPSGAEITVPLGSTVVLTASMMNLGNPVSGATLYLSQDPSSTATVSIPASVQTGASGTNTVYIISASGVGQTIIHVNNDDLTTATATINWTGSTSFTLTPTSQNATIGVTPPPTVTANFTVNGVPISNQPITLTASGNGPNNGQVLSGATTDQNGNAVFNISDTSGNPGTDTWTATTTYNASLYTSATATITWQEPTQYTVTLTPPSQSIPVNQPGGLATVNASISPTPPSGSFLTFKVMSGPNASNTSVPILINGNTASWQYNDSNSATGSDVVQAITISPSGGSSQSVTSNSVTVNWGGATTGVTLSLLPTSAQALLGGTITFTATATQANSLPAAGLGIDFTVVGPNSSQGGSKITDNNGQAVFSYTDAHATDGQQDLVTAKLSNGTQQTSSVTWVSAASENIQLCFGTSTSSCQTSGNATVGQSATITALVTYKSNSQPVGAGVGVTFSSVGGNNTVLSQTVYTNSSGVASFSYVGQQPSVDTIQATTPAATSGSTVAITWSTGNQLTFTQAPTSGTVGSQNTYTVLLSGSGNVNNVPVTFTATNASSQVVSNQTKNTNASGYVSFSYTESNASLDSIAVSSSGVTTIYTNTNWTSSNSGGNPPPSVNTVTLKANASSAYANFQRVTLTATVTTNGQPAGSGTEVTFTVTGPNARSFQGTTGSSGGVATWSYTGSSTGIDTITATVGTVTSNSVTVTWKAFRGFGFY